MARLHLLPHPLGTVDAVQTIPAGALEMLGRLRLFFVEHPKTARRLLKAAGVPAPYDHLRMEVLDKRDRGERYPDWAHAIHQAGDAGLISESGMPAIADPGEDFIRYLHQQSIKIVPYAGPSALVMALAASGLNGERFSFHGYLPVAGSARKERLRQLEETSGREGSSQIFIETPFRNRALFEDLCRTLRPQTWLCVAYGLQYPQEYILTQPIQQWREVQVNWEKIPAVYILQVPS